jgi:regulator of protease activity HflC (stomatin/prohibitin superfamily)
MNVLRYLLFATGAGLAAGALNILAWDLYEIFRLRKRAAEARKAATVKNAEALAEAKVIDSKAELTKRNLMSQSDEYHIRRVANADAERMKLEASVLKENPLLIQKIIAERLSDKVQIMMVPNDGKFFFANNVLKGMTVTGH